jgi:hypothetical protein
MIKYTKDSMLLIAAEMGLDEELVSYAKQIQSVLSSGGDGCPYDDALEMAFNELILPRLY